MQLFGLRKKYRGLQRLRQVVKVLVKYGLGHFVERLNLKSYLPMPSKWKPAGLPPEPLADSRPLAKRASQAMQELGPTFVKLGQFLSTRPDILPPVYLEEFSKLQDEVAPFPSDEAREIIESELGSKVSAVFSSFEDKPVASGSIAQVHRATVLDGEAVVIKVRRPGISRTIAEDLGLLEMFAERLEEYIPEIRVIRPRMIVEELGRHLRRELDFLHEASTTQSFHDTFAESDKYYGPRVFWDLTTGSVLTLERLAGRRISHFVAHGSPETKKQLAADLFDLYMKQFFEMGQFHADPHPGNILVEDNLKINIIDFGLSGRITDDLQADLSTALLAIRMKDVDLFSAVLEDLEVFTDETDRSQVKTDLLELMDTYIGMPLGRIDIGDAFGKFTEIAQRNALFLPRSVALQGKALVTVAGLARELDPDFDAIAALAPYLRMLIMRKFSLRSMRKSALSVGFHGASLLRNAPADLRRLIRNLLGGNMSINFRHVGLDRLINDLDKSSNRLAFSIIVASLVIASSLILHADVRPHVYGVPLLGIGGYILAALLGLWLVWAILRSGRL